MKPFPGDSPEFESRRRAIIASTLAAGMPGDLRGAVHYLCALLEDGSRDDEADRVLGVVLDAQGDAPDPFFRAAGNFRWDLDDTFLKDYNAGPFISMEFAMIARRHRDELRPATRARFDGALRRLLKGCRTRQADVAYTNIAIITCAGWLGIATFLDDRNEIAAATRAFRRWLRFTRAHGVTEFNSPNYSVVNLWGLVALRTFATDPALIAEIEDTLTWFLQDYLVHNHPATGCLAGANSRSYTYARGMGIGPVASLYCGEGAWREQSSMRFAGFPEAPVRPVFDRVRPLLTPPREPWTVTTCNGSADTTTYLAPGFTLGTMCGIFTHTQKIPVFATYTTPHARCTLYAHLSDRALVHNIHGCQAGPRALVLAGLEHVDRDPGTTDLHLLTNLGHGDAFDAVWIDGRPWDRNATALAMGQVLVARVHRTLIGLRLLRTRPFAIDDAILSLDRSTRLSIGPEGDLELRQHLIKSPTPVRLAQEGLTTGYVIELRDAEGDSPEAFGQALARIDVTDEVYLDEDGLLRRSVRALESGSDLRFDVPAWDPNLRLFLRNPEARIVRTHNGRDITPDALLDSPAHGIRREADV